MVIEVTFDTTDVYISTTVSPVYVNVSFEAPSGGGGAVWGDITGTLSDQTDLQTALDGKFDDPTGTTSQYLRGDGSLATFPSLTGFVPYTGATTNVDLGEFQLRAGQLTLDTSPTGTAAVGTTRWNDTIGSSETTLKGGSVILKNGVDLVARVVNKVSPNTTLTKAAYQAVRVSGAQGQRLAVELAQANNDNNSADTIGLVTETIATNQEGFILTVGQIENINTTGSLQGETWADGDVLYLSGTTAGRITNVQPSAPIHIVVIGYVEYAHANNGKIYVKVMNGWELNELHNVSITSVANNEALIYESATSLWKNKSIATALGYTPANAATTLTINGVTYDLSTSRTFTVGSVTGSGASGQVAYWTGTSAQSGSSTFLWNAASNLLRVNGGIGINRDAFGGRALDITGGGIRMTGSTNGSFEVNGSNSSFNVSTVGGIAGITIADTNNAIISITGNSYNYAILSNASSFRVRDITAGNADRLFIYTTGNVGINTTTDSGERLQVQGTTLLNGNVTFSSATGMFWDATNNRLGIGTNTPNSTLSVAGNLNISGGTQDYIFSKRGNVVLTLQSQNSGLLQQTEYYTKDGDGTDDNGFAIFAKGIPSDITNFEQFRYFYSSSLESYIIGTNKAGTGSYRDIRIGNTITPTDLVIKATTGNVVINSSSDSGQRLQVQGTTLLNGNVTFSSATGMFWDAANSRLGIGTTAGTGNLLHVAGNTFSNTISTNGGISLNRNGDEANLTFQRDGTPTAQLRALNGGGFRITGAAAGTEWARFHSTGNFGINTGATDTGERLQVTGNAKITGLLSVSNPTTNSFNAATFKSFYNATCGIGTDNTNGWFGIGGSDYYSNSIVCSANNTISIRTNSVSRVTISNTGATTFGNTVTASQYRLSALNTAPSTSSSTGTLGEIIIDADYIYVCTATNTWKRVAISTF